MFVLYAIIFSLFAFSTISVILLRLENLKYIKLGEELTKEKMECAELKIDLKNKVDSNQELKSELEKKELEYAALSEKVTHLLTINAEARVKSETWESLKASIPQYLDQKLKEKYKEQKEDITKLTSESLKNQLDAFNITLSSISEEFKSVSKDYSNCKDLISKCHSEIGEYTSQLSGIGYMSDIGKHGEEMIENVLKNYFPEGDLGYQRQLDISSNDLGEKKKIPDFIINIPQSANFDTKEFIVLDSKVPTVALKAYNSYKSASNKADRDKYRKEFVSNLKTHISLLDKKQYAVSGTINFVLMFVPNEDLVNEYNRDNSFNSVGTGENSKNVILVGPSSFVFYIKIISIFVRERNLGKNCDSILRVSENLYIKLRNLFKSSTRVNNLIVSLFKSQIEIEKSLLDDDGGGILTDILKLQELGVSNEKSIQKDYKKLNTTANNKLQNKLSLLSNEIEKKFPNDDQSYKVKEGQ